MERAFETASSEAQKAFGDGRMYMEKYLVNPAFYLQALFLVWEQGFFKAGVPAGSQRRNATGPRRGGCIRYARRWNHAPPVP